MKSKEPLVMAESDYFLYQPSTIASQVYLYPVDTGYFYYEPGYYLKRASYANYLLMLITRGKLTLSYRGSRYHVHQGQVVLLDCHEPHEYGNLTDQVLEVAWLHFDGVLAGTFFSMIYARFGPVITPSNVYPFEHHLGRIFELFSSSSPIREMEVSERITKMLSELLGTQTQQPGELSRNEIIEKSLGYINEHFQEPLSLEMIASHVSLSPYHFSRLFLANTGFTPHQYIIAARINFAKYLLTTGEGSVKEIAFLSGFSSESSFCSTFRKREGITPSQFRENSGTTHQRQKDD
ncbi:MAG: AraC family transcriptional regulator [Lachnospiraceae bacterium]|nr:AraC family transcriptional regulator [Lachnospiraceae bacterium]